MTKTQKYKTQSQKKNKSSSQLILILLLLIVVVIAILFVYLKYLKAEVTLIGGFNWMDEKIVIEVEGKQVEVEPMEMFKLQVEKRGEVVVTIKTDGEKNIRETKYYVGQKKGLILELVSSHEDKECLVEADVSNIYYVLEEESSIKEIVTIKDKPIESYYYEVGDDISIDYFIYPGNYSKDLLPDNLPEGTSVRGIFFVDCSNLKEEQDLRADILGSVYYDQN